MYNDTIKAIMEKMQILPESLMVMYLIKKFDISEDLARQAIFNACRSRVCSRKDNLLMRFPYLQYNSEFARKAAAFRVVIEFMPDSEDFLTGTTPWIISFLTGERLVQVCFIDKGMEIPFSIMIANKPVHPEERDYIKRIAILDKNCNPARIKRAGFSHFCIVDEDYNLDIVARIPPQEAWLDVQ